MKHGIHRRKERNIAKLFVLMEIEYYKWVKSYPLMGWLKTIILQSTKTNMELNYISNTTNAFKIWSLLE